MSPGEWCWISADGHLESGTESDLLTALAEGRIPEDNPVWSPAANSWRTLRELLHRQEEPQPEEPEADPWQPTERKPALSAPEAEALVAPSTQSDLQPCEVAEDCDGDRLSFVPTTVMPVMEAPLPVVAPPASVRPTSQTVVPPPPSPKKSLLPAVVGGGFLLLGSVVAFGWVAHAWLSPARPHAARALGEKQSSQSLQRAASSVSCKLTIPARRIAPLVVSGGPLSLASFGSQIALGATINKTTGVGFVLSPKDLSVQKTEWITDPENLSAVEPSINDSFSADRWTRSVPGTSAFSVGMTPRGFSRVGASGDQQAIWPGGAADAITRPAIASLPKSGWAISFRQGDGAGSVRLGYLDAQGKAQGELGSYADSERVSAPALAVGDGRLALAFAERGSGGAWWVVVGSSALGRVPNKQELRRIAEDAEAPAIAAVRNGRWLLAWAADHKLEARVLDERLDRVARPLTIGELPAKPAALPSIAIWSNGSRAVIAYTKDVGNWRGELWAAGLDCE